VVNIAILIVISYLFGSIPTGVWVSKLFFGFDLRDKGSGNTGSTNAFRVLGKKWGIIVQLIDILKAYIPVAILSTLLVKDISLFGLDYGSSFVIVQMLSGIFTVVGHMFPVFAKFKGGKGVNCILGMFLGIMPIDAATGLSMFIIVVILSGYVSLGSLVAIVCVPLSLVIRATVFNVEIPGFNILLSYALLMVVLLFYSHRANIKRLRAGEENRFEKIMIFKRK